MKQIAQLYKSAYQGLSPATWWLSFVMLVNRSGTMVLPFMTLYLTERHGYSIGQAGFVIAIFGLGAIFGGTLGGKLTDLFGFYIVQLSALIGGGIMFIVLGQASSFVTICTCAFFLALLNESFRPANATAIAHYSNDNNRTRCYSLNRMSVNLGWAFGGALGGFIAAHSYHLLFWVDGFTNIIAALILLLVLSPSRNSATPSRKQKGIKPEAISAYKDKPYLIFIGLTVLFAISFFQLFATLPVFFKQDLLLTSTQIGASMAINGIFIALFEMPLIYTLERQANYLRFISLGTILFAFSFVIFNLFSGGLVLVLVSTVFVTAGEMLSMPFMNTFWTSRANQYNRGQYAGLFTAAWAVAQVVGPYLGGQVAQHAGFNTLWWVVGVAGLFCALGFFWLSKITMRMG